MGKIPTWSKKNRGCRFWSGGLAKKNNRLNAFEGKLGGGDVSRIKEKGGCVPGRGGDKGQAPGEGEKIEEKRAGF